MQSFMLSSKSAQFLEYMDLTTRTTKQFGVTSLNFRCHVTSLVTWLFNSPQAISYWWSFGTKPLSRTVSEIFNHEYDAMNDMTLNDTTSKQRSMSLILVPIDFSYVTSYRLSIVTFALGCTV